MSLRPGTIALLARATLAAAAALVGCVQDVQLGARCDLTSDCPEPLVCRHERCREACRDARDCGAGLRCVAGDDGVAVCTVPSEERCSAGEPCAGTLACVDGQCRTSCERDDQCQSGSCAGGTCDEPVSGADAGAGGERDAGVADGGPADAGSRCGTPMVCGDGVLQACESEQRSALMRALVGHAEGEIELLDPHTFAPTQMPTESPWGALPPQLALGASAGAGVVGWIEAGTTETPRALVLRRFPLDDLASAEVVDTPITSARSLALSEDGAQVVGFVVMTPPATAGQTSAYVLEIPAAGAASIDTLGAGDPPSDARGRLAIVGGASAMLGTSFPRFLVNREDPPNVVPFGSSLSIGAVDAALAQDTYRQISTAAFSDQLYLDLAGGPGNIVVTHDPERLFGLGVWHVRRTEPLTAGGSLETIQHLEGVGADEVRGGPAVALADAEGLDHVIAFPTSGGVRFVSVVCPIGAPCGAASPLGAGTLASSSGLDPRALAMARVVSGYVYAVVEPAVAGGPGRALHLRAIDTAGQPVPLIDEGAAGALLGDLARAEEDIADVRIAAARGGDAVTVLVAALIRDTTRTRDVVWVGGVRACERR